MSIWDSHKLSSIFFPYCTEEEERIKNQGIDLAYYCSLDTLFNILNNKELWLRNIRCMSDYRELFFGFNTLKEALYDNKERLNRLLSVLYKINSSRRNEWDNLFDSVFIPINENDMIFILCKYTNIICFTEHDPKTDENGRLEMFNSYGRGNGGCIVFDAKAAIDSDNSLSKVIYVRDAKDPVLVDKLEQLIGSIDKNIEYLQSIDFDKVLFYMGNAIIYAIISIKHYGFAYEKEWRLILSSQAISRDKDSSDYDQYCVPVCLNGVPQMVFKQSLDDKESLVKSIIIENKFEQMEEKLCLAHLLLKKWKKGKQEALDLIKISDIPIKR